MDKQRLKEQVEIIRQAFGYIDQFKNRTFVIKLEDSLVTSPLSGLLIRDLALLHRMGIRIVIVPGARQRIDEVLEQNSIVCRTVDGVRISPAHAMPFIKMAAFDISNKVMTQLAENNTTAVIGNWVRARSIGVRGGTDFQSSGIVDKLQTATIKNVLDDGMVPIFPNIGWSLTGAPYNISSNELALTLARELGAAKLFFVTETGLVASSRYTVPERVYVSSEGIVGQLTVQEAGDFLRLNAKKKHEPGWELVSCGREACTAGVHRTHIVDGRVEGVVLKEIFSNRGVGTMIYADRLDDIRPMTPSDIPAVLGIMEPLAEAGVLVKRTAAELSGRLDEFAVYEVDGTIHACGGLHLFPDRTGEICGVAVDDSYENMGTGRRMVAWLMNRAAQAKCRKVFLLTTRASDWFYSIGFKKGTLKDLPKEKRAGYDVRRNSLILVCALPGRRLHGGLRME